MKALLAIDGSTESAYRARNGGQPGLARRRRAIGPDGPAVGGGSVRRPVGGRRRLRPRGRRARRSADRSSGPSRTGRGSTAAAGLELTTRLIEGRAASVIVDTAREIGADLIIVGARGHGAIEEAFLGSVSAEVVDQGSLCRARGATAVCRTHPHRHRWVGRRDVGGAVPWRVRAVREESGASRPCPGCQPDMVARVHARVTVLRGQHVRIGRGQEGTGSATTSRRRWQRGFELTTSRASAVTVEGPAAAAILA